MGEDAEVTRFKARVGQPTWWWKLNLLGEKEGLNGVGSSTGVGETSGELVLVRRIPVEGVGHEENVRTRWDEGMARFRNLKAQETERTH